MICIAFIKIDSREADGGDEEGDDCPADEAEEVSQASLCSLMKLIIRDMIIVFLSMLNMHGPGHLLIDR